MKILNDMRLVRSQYLTPREIKLSDDGLLIDAKGSEMFVDGDIYASDVHGSAGDTHGVYCETLHQWSDRTMKENITDAGLTTEDIAALPVVRFNFIGKDEQRIGTIAQEVQKVCPELVKADKAGRLTLDYATLGAVIGIECAKEIVALRKEIEQLKNR